MIIKDDTQFFIQQPRRGEREKLMTVHLLNSAMMPQQGTYQCEQTSRETFAHLVRTAHDNGSLKSYIGYQETAKLIEHLAGVPIQVSRVKTVLQRGDVMLVARLMYRLANPANKENHKPTAENFEFFKVTYS